MVNYKKLYREECEHAEEYFRSREAAWKGYDELRAVLIHAFGFPDDLTHDELLDLLKNELVIFSVNTLDRSITSQLGLSPEPIISEVNSWMNQ